MIHFYGYRVRLQEKSKSLGRIGLEIISITVALYFVMMFFSKVEETQQSIHYFTQRLDTENVVVSTPNNTLNLSVLHTVTKNTEEYVQIHQTNSLVKVLEVDEHYQHFYHMATVLEQLWHDFMTQLNTVILSADLAKKCNLKIGDIITLRNRTYTVLTLVSDPWLKGKILITKADTSAEIPSWRQSYTITLSSHDIKAVDSSYPTKSLSEEFQKEILSLKGFLIFLTVFSALFISIAVVNIFLIFKTSLQREKKSRQIKWLYGETKRQFVGRVCLEYTLTAMVAFHVSIVLYYLLLPFVPTFFQFQLTYSVYRSELLFVLVVSIIFAWGLSAKQVSVGYDRIWRE